MRTQGRKRYLRMVMWLVPLAVLLSVVTIVWASHTVLTVRADMVTADRIEGRVSIERILDRMGDITIDEELHGPAGARQYNYEPTFILRGLTEINIKFTPVG